MANGHGGKRPGAGRKKGGSNVAILRNRELIWQYCEEIGTDPFRVLVNELQHDDVAKRLEAAKALAPYLQPQLQRGEVDVGDQLKRILEHRYGRSDNGRTNHQSAV